MLKEKGSLNINLYIEINPDFTAQKIESLHDYTKEELIFLITIHK